MNKKYVGFAIIPIVVIIIGFSINFENDDSKVEKFVDPYSSYIILNKDIEDVLEIQGISISSPLKFTSKNTIEKYCSFFSDEKRQDLVKYCTSTELRDSNGINLTHKGNQIADTIRQKHGILLEFFDILGIGHETANRDAEGIEHYLNQKTIRQLRKFITFLKSNPKVIENFRNL